MRHDVVMVAATFEEKTYETAYNIELATGRAGSRRVFSPGQVLEKLTGFDVAADPGSAHLIWRVLAAPRPSGLSLLPSHWVSSPSGLPRPFELPRMPVSLILQFKRPEFLRGSSAKQWRLWRSPYYRFTRSRDQHSVLTKLERNLGGKAVVRYAAPAFHTLAELEAAQQAGEVITKSGHVSPCKLSRHRVWTYNKPGTVGRGNPSGHRHLFESFDDLFMSLVIGQDRPTAELVPFDGLGDHLADVAEACRLRAPRLRRVVAEWAVGLPPLELQGLQVQNLIDYATIQTLMTWQRATWWLLDGLEVVPTT